MNKFKEFLASINLSEVKPHTVVSPDFTGVSVDQYGINCGRQTSD